MLTIRPETHADYKTIVKLVLDSFSKGTNYSDGTDVVALIEEIRDSEYRVPELSFVCELDGEIVGHFMFSRFPLSESPDGALIAATQYEFALLAPVAVRADKLRVGIGKRMLTLGLERAREFGFKAALVEGNFAFYNRVGFVTSSEFGISPTSGSPMTEPRCMMCQELYPGALKGKGGYVRYAMYHNA